MRLTLRTLLAYLDDVLDPVDKDELAQKIESSEFAEDLVHRTRDTVRRLRLSAPQVIGTGMGLDPNTVAEYLDNVMPPEQVGDFERICLESDVHLAEATACHHVLTMVLGAPADVDPIARQRMYTIASEAADRKRLRVEPAHTAAVAAALTPAQPIATPAPTYAPQPRSSEIPEYLRAGGWWRSTNAVIGLAAVVLIGTAIMFVSGLGGWFGGTKSLEPLTADNSTLANPAPEFDTVASNDVAPPAVNPDVESTAAAMPNNTTPPPLSSPPQPMTPSMPPLTATPAVPPASNDPAASDRYAVQNNPPAIAPPSQPGATDIAAAQPTPPPTESLPPDATTNIPPAESAASIPSLPFSEAPTGDIPPEMPAPLPPQVTPPDTASPDATPPATSVAASTPLLPDAAPGAPELKGPPEAGTSAVPVVPIAPPDSGTYMGGKTVLLRHDDKSGAWFRVEPRAAIIPGERVLSLPEFRPRIVLVSGLQLDLAGGTQVVMGISDEAAAAAALPPSSDITPSLELVYGRLVLVNPSNTEKQVRLKLGATTGVATLGHNATLAIEVERKHVPGQDPRQTAAPVETRLFAPEGGVTWHDAAGDKVIEKPSRWMLAEGAAGEVADDASPPEWIDHEPITQLSEQRYGAPVIESTLVSNAPADTQLLELFQGSSRKEVKSLVARSSIHVGLFQPFIAALRDSEQKANWKMHIDALRAAMALNPESANKVFQSLVDQRGKPAAADLYEMLCGYNTEQIGQSTDQMKSGAIVKLINWLENDSLDYRVLAVQDLWETTGKRLMPNPAANLPERTQNVKRWRSRLEAGELKPVSQP